LLADGDDPRALGRHCQAMCHRGVGIEIAPAIRERGGRDVQNRHPLHRFAAHLRKMRSSASAREAGLVLNWPRTADVVVTAPGLRTPRIAMHRCSASTTTITPRGSSLR